MNVLMMWMPGPTEMIIIVVIGIMLFGRRLPEVGRSLGKSIVEFKKGIRDVEQDINSASERRDQQPPASERKDPALTQANAPQTVPESERREEQAPQSTGSD